MNVIYLLFLLLAAVLFVAHAFGVRHPKVDFVALGLFFWVLVPLGHALQRL